MIIDSSALLAVALPEPDAGVFARALASELRPKISAGTWLEACIVVNRRQNVTASARFEALLKRLKLVIVSVDAEQAAIAREAHQRFGRGNHPARLNYGDCFAYALAKVTGEPLLFQGNDFRQTDIAAAL